MLFAGLKTGRWTLIQPDDNKPYHWICECSCDGRTRKSVRDYSLSNKKSSSCGCARRQALSTRNRTHGMTDKPIYKAWKDMWDRVRNDPNYTRKGIRVCDRWRTFENFYADVRDKPEGRNISLDRIDSRADYQPGNWRWTTPLVQTRNRTTTVLITSERFNTTKPLAEWAYILLSHTGKPKWNSRRLKSAIDLLDGIDPILQAARITSLNADCADDYTEAELVAA